MALTYTSVDDYVAYAGLAAAPTGDDLTKLTAELEQAERDIDAILGPIPHIGALKFNPAALQAWEALALSRAVCAQAEYVSAAGGRSGLSERVVDRVKGPDFEVQYGAGAGTAAGTRVRYGAAVKTELAPIAHLRRLGGVTV